MAEMDRFEARLAASLRQLADEVPTEVDASLVASTAGAAHPAGTRAIPTLVGWRGRLVPGLRLAIVVALLALLAYAAVVLAPRLVSPPLPSIIHGLIRCDGESWTSRTAPVVLTCSVDLGDPRLAGAATIAVDAAAGQGALGRTGRVELGAGGTRWVGPLVLERSPAGMVAGDALLGGSGGSAGYTLELHVFSSDGLEWGVLGSVHSR